MIDRAHDAPITKQAQALNISRGSVYYVPRPASEVDLAMMRRLDRLLTDRLTPSDISSENRGLDVELNRILGDEVDQAAW